MRSTTTGTRLAPTVAMRVRDLVRKLKLGLAGLVGAVACSRPVVPSETPPMALTSLPSPKLESSHEPMQKPPADAGVQDAVALPPVPDAMPPDANKRADQAAFSCC
jgi:hypothetical protein